MTFTIRLALFGLLASIWLAPLAQARSFESEAREAREQRLAAVTIYVDANWGNRTGGAAKALTRAHQAFAAQDFVLLDVEPYSENGDLQGFFVSYRSQAEAGIQP